MQKEQKPTELRDTVDAAEGWGQLHAKPLEVFFRKNGTPGELFFRRHAYLAVIYLPVFCMVMGQIQTDKEMTPVMIFTGLYILGLASHAQGRKQLAKEGKQSHSYYVGESIFGRTPAAKRFAEPLAAVAIGIMLFELSKGLGLYFMVGGVALKIQIEAILMRENARVRALRDARIEQENLMRTYRDG